jgi:hypothetical protein
MTDIHEIEREPYMDSSTLAEHVKCVGKAIMDDADNIALKTSKIISIEISALIAPGDRVTRINYDIDRYADPRLPDK